jgi:hypothetical protein
VGTDPPVSPPPRRRARLPPATPRPGARSSPRRPQGGARLFAAVTQTLSLATRAFSGVRAGELSGTKTRPRHRTDQLRRRHRGRRRTACFDDTARRWRRSTSTVAGRARAGGGTRRRGASSSGASSGMKCPRSAAVQRPIPRFSALPLVGMLRLSFRLVLRGWRFRFMLLGLLA